MSKASLRLPPSSFTSKLDATDWTRELWLAAFGEPGADPRRRPATASAPATSGASATPAGSAPAAGRSPRRRPGSLRPPRREQGGHRHPRGAGAPGHADPRLARSSRRPAASAGAGPGRSTSSPRPAPPVAACPPRPSPPRGAPADHGPARGRGTALRPDRPRPRGAGRCRLGRGPCRVDPARVAHPAEPERCRGGHPPRLLRPDHASIVNKLPKLTINRSLGPRS